MSVYHLHARLFEGPLNDPARNELQSRESDSMPAVVELAEELAARGFAVWVYEHDHTLGRTASGEGAYRVVAEWRAGGARRG